MKKIKIIFLIVFFFPLFYQNINAEQSNQIGTNQVLSNEDSEQLKKLMDQYKNGIITGYEYAKEKKKILN